MNGLASEFGYRFMIRMGDRFYKHSYVPFGIPRQNDRCPLKTASRNQG